MLRIQVYIIEYIKYTDISITNKEQEFKQEFVYSVKIMNAALILKPSSYANRLSIIVLY